MQPKPHEVRIKRDEYEGVPSEANEVRGHLEKRPYLHVLCGSKPHSHPQTLSTLCVRLGSSQSINSQNVNSQNVKSQNVNSQNVNSQNVNFQNVNS